MEDLEDIILTKDIMSFPLLYFTPPLSLCSSVPIHNISTGKIKKIISSIDHGTRSFGELFLIKFKQTCYSIYKDNRSVSSQTESTSIKESDRYSLFNIATPLTPKGKDLFIKEFLQFKEQIMLYDKDFFFFIKEDYMNFVSYCAERIKEKQEEDNSLYLSTLNSSYNARKEMFYYMNLAESRITRRRIK